jgi:hypothetical protein
MSRTGPGPTPFVHMSWKLEVELLTLDSSLHGRDGPESSILSLMGERIKVGLGVGL